jgi:TolB-like protein/tetratricopeptide (TPR) repeat protein
VTDPSRAVFLSYASQDAEAARRIGAALRSAGIEVWLDQSELRGGDAWDQKIRQQIRDCALFVPIISANTNARSEGYFRLEWKLAVDRSHLMAEDRPFLLPIVIDDLAEITARVPDRFRERQWLRLAAESADGLAERVRILIDDAFIVRASASGSGPAGLAPGSTDNSRAAVSSGRAGSRRLWHALGAVAACAALVGGFALYRGAHRASAERAAAQKAQQQGEGDPNPLALAILPFSNETGDPKLAYVADGLTASLAATITSDLTSTGDATISPPAVTAAYQHAVDPARQLGKDLGVHFVLQGNVQKAGTRIRFTGELLDASSGRQLWSETYDGDQSDLLALQDRVANNESFEDKMFINAAHNSEIRRGTPTEADYYVRGYALEYGDRSVQTKQRELALFRQMLALNPNDPKAMVCVASAATDVASAGFAARLPGEEIEPYFKEGHSLASKAQALGSHNPWVYEVLALYARYHDDYSGWLENSKAWLDVFPTNTVAYVYVGNAYLQGGDAHGAMPFLQKALDMDQSPPNWGQYRYLGKARFMLGDFVGAIDALQRARTLQPSNPIVLAYLAMAGAVSGDQSTARAAADRLRGDATFNFAEFERLEKPMPSGPSAYKAWWESKLIPAWRRAGLPQ